MSYYNQDELYSQEEIHIKLKKSLRYDLLCLFLNNCPNICWEVLRIQNWSYLQILQLKNSGVTDHHMQIFSRMNWPELNRLNLYNNSLITAKGVHKFFSNNQYPSLESIAFGSQHLTTQIGNQGFLCLLNAKKELWKQIWFNDAKLTSLVLEPFLNFTESSLTCLWLKKNQIGNQGAILLSKINSPNLKKIYIGECKIGEQRMKSIVKGKWPNLIKLSLNDNHLGLNGLQMFHNSCWDQLQNLWISCPKQQILFSKIILMKNQFIRLYNKELTHAYQTFRFLIEKRFFKN